MFNILVSIVLMHVIEMYSSFYRFSLFGQRNGTCYRVNNYSFEHNTVKVGISF